MSAEEETMKLTDAEETARGLRAACQFVASIRFDTDARVSDLREALEIIDDLIDDGATTLRALVEQAYAERREEISAAIRERAATAEPT